MEKELTSEQKLYILDLLKLVPSRTIMIDSDRYYSEESVLNLLKTVVLNPDVNRGQVPLKTAREYFNNVYSNQVFIPNQTIAIKTDTIWDIMEKYASQFQVPLSDEEIENNFNNSPDNLVHPDRYRTEGAKWYRNRSNLRQQNEDCANNLQDISRDKV